MFLAGCGISPQRLGVSDEEWASYDKAHRMQLLNNYHKIEMENTVADTEQDATKHVNEENKDKGSAANASEALKVSISGGKVMMPPFVEWQPYKPFDFLISKNECIDAAIMQADSDVETSLRSCYKDDILYVDPSRYDIAKKDGSINFHFSPLWAQAKGFTYAKISSDGYVRLKDVNVNIKQDKNTP